MAGGRDGGKPSLSLMVRIALERASVFLKVKKRARVLTRRLVFLAPKRAGVFLKVIKRARVVTQIF